MDVKAASPSSLWSMPACDVSPTSVLTPSLSGRGGDASWCVQFHSGDAFKCIPVYKASPFVCSLVLGGGGEGSQLFLPHRPHTDMEDVRWTSSSTDPVTPKTLQRSSNDDGDEDCFGYWTTGLANSLNYATTPPALTHNQSTHEIKQKKRQKRQKRKQTKTLPYLLLV